MDILLERFRSLYDLHQNLSADEAMIRFSGRSTMKQYMPLKPIRRGYKVWMLADAERGYVSNLEFYTGKKGDKCELGLGGRVIRTLTEKIRHRSEKNEQNNSHLFAFLGTIMSFLTTSLA